MPSYFYHIALELFSHSETDFTQPIHSACEALRPFQKRPRHPPRTLRNDKADARSDTPSSDLARAPSTSRLANDSRLDELSIGCIDMVPPEQQHDLVSRPGRPGKRDTHPHSVFDNPVATGIGTDILGGLRTKGRYVPLDQKTDSVWGVVHLYRDAQETPYLSLDNDYPAELKGSAAARSQCDELGGTNTPLRDGEAGQDSQATVDDDCTTLCILAVPSYLSPSDFLGFVGEGTMDAVSHFRMIRTARANRYMVLLKFRSGKKAVEWQRVWNGKVFNSMEPETCHVVFVKTVEIQTVDPQSELSTPQHPCLNPLASPTPRAVSSAGQSFSSRPHAPRTPALIELPTCPVCLERMDETTGLLTIICQHVFHCTCLQKWKGSGCPVCRYTQDDVRRSSQPPWPSDDATECNVCHSELNLWVCLICGNVGCGRYDGAHAFAHYRDTAHAFAMDLATQRVWDYVGDAYVHRIIQSKTDGGKLVELPAADNSALDPPDFSDAVPREKLENMSVEYTHLLTSQLESQRAYFEEVVERAADKASRASAAATSAQEAAQRTSSSLHDLQSKYDTLTSETIPAMERDKTRAEKRAVKFEGMARKLEKEWREEKTVNESLMGRIEFLSSEVETLKTGNADLVEQNRDLTFFISGSQRLQDQSEDVVQGTVSVPDPPAEGNGKGKKKKGKGRK